MSIRIHVVTGDGKVHDSRTNKTEVKSFEQFERATTVAAEQNDTRSVVLYVDGTRNVLDHWTK